MDIDEKIKAMREWADSEDGQAYFKKLNDDDAREKTRHVRFEEWLEHNDFDKLMSRLILEHGDEYIDKCYHKGYMPHPNNKLNFVIGYVIENFASVNVNELDCDFANEIWQFKGYYFQHIHGQGTIFRLYNKDDNQLILQV